METKPMTNADRIREMTDEESRMSFCPYCPVKDCCGCEDECAKAWLAWLRAPVESEGEQNG